MRKKIILDTISIVELKPGGFNEFMLNGEWPSEKERYEVTLASMEGEKGWFANLIRRHIKRKLEKGIFKPPKKLDKDARRSLEENGEDPEEYAKGLAAAIASKECGLVDGKPDKIDTEVEVTINKDGKRVFTVKFYTYK